MRSANITLDLYAILIMTILLAVCIIQRRQNKMIQKYLICWMIAHILMLVCDVLRWSVRGKIEQLGLFTTMFFFEYFFAYLCLVFFHYYFIDCMGELADINQKWRLIVWPIAIVMPILWVVSYENRMFYTITYNAVNVPNAGYYFSQLPGVFLIVFDMAMVFLYKKRIGWRVVLTLWLYMIFPLIAFPMQLGENAEILFIGMTLSLITRYATISSEQNRLLAESKARLAESRIAITMSQIQPHFLYNALGSISALCDIDPVRAREATDHFAGYLRMNLESMRQLSPIPFRTELNHIETYIWLETMRFGAKLQVSYEIQTKDFRVPALSVQPIVENAVKHGVCQKENGGLVVISTQETETDYLIQVKDNGVGFCWRETIEYTDGKLHIGIKNVKSRLETVVDGDLHIQSRIGEGTVATIRIPKERGTASE